MRISAKAHSHWSRTGAAGLQPILCQHGKVLEVNNVIIHDVTALIVVTFSSLRLPGFRESCVVGEINKTIFIQVGRAPIVFIGADVNSAIADTVFTVNIGFIIIAIWVACIFALRGFIDMQVVGVCSNILESGVSGDVADTGMRILEAAVIDSIERVVYPVEVVAVIAINNAIEDVGICPVLS